MLIAFNYTLDSINFFINFLCLFQDPIHGTILDLVFISLWSPLVCDSFLVFSCFFMIVSFEEYCLGIL